MNASENTLNKADNMDIVLKNTDTATIQVIPQPDNTVILRIEPQNTGVQKVSTQSGTSYHKQDKKPVKTPIETLEEFYNEESLKYDCNEKELNSFKTFYTKVIKEKGWKGEFKAEELYKSWLSKAR